jgi:hypothetical protein
MTASGERCHRCSRPLQDEEIAAYSTPKIGSPERNVWCEECLAAVVAEAEERDDEERAEREGR